MHAYFLHFDLSQPFDIPRGDLQNCDPTDGSAIVFAMVETAEEGEPFPTRCLAPYFELGPLPVPLLFT